MSLTFFLTFILYLTTHNYQRDKLIIEARQGFGKLLCVATTSSRLHFHYKYDSIRSDDCYSERISHLGGCQILT